MTTNKKLIIILIAVAVVSAVGFAGYYFWMKKVGGPAPGGEETASPEKLRYYINFPDDSKDSDKDGLTDGEEKKLGTSNSDFDTDGDGLSDQAELQNTKTDPIKADTDNDGFADGLEIVSGYNPLGAGKTE